MNLKEYLEKQKEQRKIIENAKEKIKSINELYLKENFWSKFSKGDRVELFNDVKKSQGFGYLDGCSICEYSGNYHFVIKAEKKDGTPSKNNIGCWFVDSITKAPKE